MAKAARAIIIQNDKILVMHRDKEGSQYYTLVGGRANEDEPLEKAVVREVKEETGLTVTEARLVFVEDHPAPYNQQYIFLCTVAPHESISIQETSEEALMNRVGINLHRPEWVSTSVFPKLHFYTHQLQTAIASSLQSGFPTDPVNL